MTAVTGRRGPRPLTPAGCPFLRQVSSCCWVDDIKEVEEVVVGGAASVKTARCRRKRPRTSSPPLTTALILSGRRFASCVTWESGWTYRRSNNPSADRLTNLIEKICSCLFLQSAAQTLINRSGIKEIIPKSTRFTVFLVDMRSSRFPWAVSEYCFLIYFQFSISPWWSDLSLLELNTLIVSPWNSLVEVSTNRL